MTMKARTIEGGAVRLVPLGPDHTGCVVRWRNAPQARRAFLSDTPVTAESHSAWLAGKAGDASDLTYVIETPDGRAVGMVALYRIDRGLGTAEFGRLLIGEPGMQGRGLAAAAARTLIGSVAVPLGLSSVHLEVFADNTRAVALYERLGFVTDTERPHPSGRRVLHMRRPL